MTPAARGPPCTGPGSRDPSSLASTPGAEPLGAPRGQLGRLCAQRHVHRLQRREAAGSGARCLNHLVLHREAPRPEAPRRRQPLSAPGSAAPGPPRCAPRARAPAAGSGSRRATTAGGFHKDSRKRGLQRARFVHQLNRAATAIIESAPLPDDQLPTEHPTAFPSAIKNDSP